MLPLLQHVHLPIHAPIIFIDLVPAHNMLQHPRVLKDVLCLVSENAQYNP